MKRESINYFAVGLFVLAGLAALLFVLYRLAIGVGDRDTYYTRYHNVAGLTPGTLVTYEGYVLGQVSAIEPQQSSKGTYYRVEMQIHSGWRIPDDSIARINSRGLLADTVVAIAEGHSPNFISPGGMLKGEQGVDLFATMGELAGNINDLSEQTLRPLLDNLNRSVQQVGGELEHRLPLILDDVQKLVEKLDASATHLSTMLNTDTEVKTRRILNNIDLASTNLQEMSHGLLQVKREARQLIRKLDHLVTQSQPDLQHSIGDLRRILQQVSHYSDSILQNLDSSSRNMNEFSRQIRENPGRLLGTAVPHDRGVQRE